MRNTFVEELSTLAKEGGNVALVVGDLGYSVIEPFVEKFPERFVNAGVAEQNMTGLAAGMASEGFHVFTYSIANFPTFRCAEQIRNDIDYQALSVTVVAVGGGLAYGALGYSHHAVQDYGLIRLMPNFLIAAPADPYEVRSCVRYLFESGVPSYLRLGKAGEPCIHGDVPVIKPGGWLRVRGNGKALCAVVVTGAPLSDVLDWVKECPYELDVYSCPLWGMPAKTEQVVNLKNYSRVLTVEDHLVDGGFGSWMCEASRQLPKEVRPIVECLGLDPKVCGMVGSQRVLNSLGGLTKDAFLSAISRLFS